jgi:hypothetical protein
MIPLPIRITITAVGAIMMIASFVIRSSVDRGLEIRTDRPPALTTDAGAFSLRVAGAFILGIGLLTWVAARSIQTHTGIF